MICPVQTGKSVKLRGRIEEDWRGAAESDAESLPRLRPPVSMTFLAAIMVSISQS